MTRLGPGELTLAEIPAEAGVTAGALVQRFGSKRDLLLQLSAGAADGNAQFIRGLRKKQRSPIAALRAYAECLAETTLSGSLITWAIYRDGDATSWLRADVDAVIAPYLPRRRRR